MYSCRSELKELNLNAGGFQFETTREPPNSSTKIPAGKTQEDLVQTAPRWIVLIVDQWQVSRLSESKFEGLVSVTRNYDNTSCVSCLFGSEWPQAIFKRKWTQLKLAEPILREDLSMESRFTLSTDRLRVTIFANSDTRLLKDIEKNLSWFEHSENVPQTAPWTPEGVYVSYGKKMLPIMPKAVAGHEIPLKKSQVTYLIGKNGIRIESLREISHATIKILPISKRLTERELNHPDCVVQSISVTGNWFEVARAFAFIEAHLALHREGPRRMLL